MYNGYPTDCMESPLEPNVFLIPPDCTDVQPPDFNPATHFAVFNDGEWTLSDVPVEQEEEPIPEIQREPMQVLREVREALLNESDIYVIKHLENGQAVPQGLKDYRQALRDIPQKIEAGQYPMPTLEHDETGGLPTVVFNNWPEYTP